MAKLTTAEKLSKAQTKELAKIEKAEAKAAYAKAINDTAFEVRRKMQAEMAAVFDRPTPYILRSVTFKGATADRRLPAATLDGLAAMGPLEVVEHAVLPVNFACPNLIAIGPDGLRTGVSDAMSPWSAALGQ
jgi:hypothetical protein